MANVVIPYRFRVKRDTSANWTSNNPTLLEGEIGLETDTGLRKMGDGSTAWNSLLYDGIGAIDLTGLADGNVLVYDSGTQTWAPGAGGGGGVWSTIVKPTNENRASTTTFADDTDFTFALTSGATYVIRGVVFVVLGLSSAGFKYQFAYSGTTSAVQSYRNNYSVSGGSSGTDNDFTFAGTFLPSGSSSGGSVTRLRTAVDILITPSSDGTLAFQWAQVSSSAAGTSVMAGSWMEIAEV